MSKSDKFSTLVLCVVSFALTLEAAPHFYPDNYDSGYHSCLHNRRYRLGPQETRGLIQNPEYRFYSDDRRPCRCFDRQYEESCDCQRYPRSDGASAGKFLPRNSIDKGFYPRMMHETPIIETPSNRLYVVRPAPSNFAASYDDDDFAFAKKTGRRSENFPISMNAREKSTGTNERRALTDEELGKIVRKAVTGGKYEEVEDLPMQRRYPESVTMTKPLRGSDFVYKPRNRQNYADAFLIPKMNIAGITTEEMDEGIIANEKNFELDDDAPVTIEEQIQGVEVRPYVVPDVSLTETEPEVYKFVDDVVTTEEDDENREESVSDDVMEGDVVLSISEEDDEKLESAKSNEKHDGDESSIIAIETEIPTTEISEIPEIGRDPSLADDVNEQPPTPTVALMTEETTTNISTTPVE